MTRRCMPRNMLQHVMNCSGQQCLCSYDARASTMSKLLHFSSRFLMTQALAFTCA